jgi:hypothetical protein
VARVIAAGQVIPGHPGEREAWPRAKAGIQPRS